MNRKDSMVHKFQILNISSIKLQVLKLIKIIGFNKKIGLLLLKNLVIQILEQEITKKNFELNNINKVLPADKRKIDLDLKTNSKVLPDLNTKKISDKKVEKKESFAVNVSNMARTSNRFRKSNHTSK